MKRTYDAAELSNENDDSGALPKLYPRDTITPAALNSNRNYLKLMTWNVNGFKAHVLNMVDIIKDIISKHNPDVICLQETKLQESHVTSDCCSLLDDYNSYWNCSTAKKGYSGTVMFIKKNTVDVSSAKLFPAAAKAFNAINKSKKQATLSSFWGKKEKKTTDNNNNSKVSALAIAYDFEDDHRCFDGEGRTITIEFDKFYVVGCYVPNSGEVNLSRLDYRVDEWDPHMRDYLKQLSSRKPVIFTGDLNCAHLDIDMFNPKGKRTPTEAGTTPRERASFSAMLEHANLVDAFRHHHPEAKGQFTYWHLRTFTRNRNHGLRLDYFLCSRDLFPVPPEMRTFNDAASATPIGSEVDSNDKSNSIAPIIADCFILHEETVGCSDHCPVMLVIAL